MSAATREAPAKRPPNAHHAEHEADRAADRAMLGEPLGFTVAAHPGATTAPDERPASSGQPLDPTIRSTMERSFGHDFGRVRVHADPAAAGRQSAAAYTVGHDIVVGTPYADPGTPHGRWLFGHELAHVVQQDRAGTPAVQRIDAGEWFARLFGEGTFETPELKRYLQFLDEHDAIEGDMTSDNKAREIIRRWRAGDPDFPEPTLKQKQLMLLEMIDGPTGDEDEHAILELLRGSSATQVRTLLGTAGGVAELRGEFHGSEDTEFGAFLATWESDPQNRPVGEEEIGTKKGQVPIKEVVVDQDTPQTVTIEYRDGRMEAFPCSTGKGTFAVEPGGRGPTPAETRVTDSNWTPNGTHTVQFKREAHPRSGIPWWTQFHSRGIALHEFDPVDGTPLSHGCVRLDKSVAKRIFNGAVRGSTTVRVIGTPTPRLTHAALVDEWRKDFRSGAVRPADGGDGDLRAHLRLAFGTRNDAELDRKIAAGEIPRRGGRP